MWFLCASHDRGSQLRLSYSLWLFLHIKWNPRSVLWERTHSQRLFLRGSLSVNICLNPGCIHGSSGHRLAERADVGRWWLSESIGKADDDEEISERELISRPQWIGGRVLGASRCLDSHSGNLAAASDLLCSKKDHWHHLFRSLHWFLCGFERVEKWENPSCNKDICFKMNFWKIPGGVLWVWAVGCDLWWHGKEASVFSWKEGTNSVCEEQSGWGVGEWVELRKVWCILCVYQGGPWRGSH